MSTSNFPQLRGHCLSNYTSDPVFRASLPRPPEEDPQGAVLRWVQVFGSPLTWDDLGWLRSLTKLPLLVKGICHPDDARRAKDGGVDGTTARTTAAGKPTAACPRWNACRAWSRRPTGCRSCSIGHPQRADVIKALALARPRWVSGRPYAFGLALGGVDGIVHVLRMMLAEADLIMAIDGYPTLKI